MFRGLMLDDFLLKPSLLIPLDQKQLLESIPARKESPALPFPSPVKET